MFNKKLKQRISILESESDFLRQTIKDQEKKIKSLQWQLDNPPKFKKGDKFGDLVVIDRIFKRPSFYSTTGWLFLLELSIYFRKPIRKETIDRTKNDLDAFYHYQLINTKTGEKVMKKEFELVILKNKPTS